MSSGDPLSRRRFLTARGLGASTGGMIAALMPDPPLMSPDQDDRGTPHCTVARRAMACDFTVHISLTRPDLRANAEPSAKSKPWKIC